MLTTVFLALTWAAPAAPEAPTKDDPPAKKELFAKEAFYKEQKGKEQVFEGVLRYKPLPKGVGTIGRHNAFTLEMTAGGKKDVREVYVGAKPELLKPYADKRVKITGKPVEMEVVGKVHREVWPASIELVKAAAKPKEREPVSALAPTPPKKEPTKVEVLAKAPFAGAVRGGAAQQKVIRSGEEMAAALGLPADKAKEATDRAAKMFKKADVDWKKQMVVVVTAGMKRTGGYSVEVTDLTVADKALTVKWKLNSPGPRDFVTMALTHPGVAVLVDRFDGTVKFDPGLPKAGGKEK